MGEPVRSTTDRLCLTLSNQQNELPELWKAVDTFLVDRDIPKRTRHHVRLAMEELVVNIIYYAYDTTLPRLIQSEVSVSEGAVCVNVSDDGKPFDPLTAAEPALNQSVEEGRSGGVGLKIIKGLTTDLEYDRFLGKNRVKFRVDVRE